MLKLETIKRTSHRQAASLPARYAEIRARTVRLAAPLTPEDCCIQSMPDASPVKWHLAHTTWFFETFVLAVYDADRPPFHPAFRVLFNSYYQGIGPMHPRPQRGLLSRPTLTEILDYRQAVDEAMQHLFAPESLQRNPELTELLELGLQHEQQHQELILTDLKHLLAQNPLSPAYQRAGVNISRESQPAGWVSYPGGIVQIGHAEGGFSFDNERPRHRQYLEPFQLATRPVSNAEFLEFIEDGGYERPALWLAEGYDWLRVSSQITRQGPLYWRHDDGQWREFTLHGLEPLAPGTPVSHVSYYEADAYARWRNARLPTEAEWEYAADGQPVCGNFADNGHYHPRPAEDVEEPGLHQLYGDVWEWTQSSYSPYPGFKPAAGSTGEYNGKFMVNQYVLRGGSCASAAGHIRPSYRNFFPASACWQFSGIRLARDTV